VMLLGVTYFPINEHHVIKLLSSLPRSVTIKRIAASARVRQFVSKLYKTSRLYQLN